MSDLAVTIPVEKRKAIAQNEIKVLERLMLVACRKEAISTLKKEGERALTRSQLLFGGAAMDSIMSDPNVMAGLNESTALIDMAKSNEFGKDAGAVARQNSPLTMAGLDPAIQGNKHRAFDSGWAGQARPW